MEKNARKPNLPAIAFALAALTAAISSPASADEVQRRELVPYGDLNLATQAGIETLDRRLDRAVERVCGTASVKEVLAKRQVMKCRKEAWRSIRADREFAIAKATRPTNVALGQRQIISAK